MGLNLSRGQPTKYYSSNRIALVINGETFVHKNVQMSDFFSSKELVFYSSLGDLADKIIFYNRNDPLRKKIALNGKKKYFKIFNEKKIAKYFIDISIGKDVSII